MAAGHVPEVGLDVASQRTEVPIYACVVGIKKRDVMTRLKTFEVLLYLRPAVCIGQSPPLLLAPMEMGGSNIVPLKLLLASVSTDPPMALTHTPPPS